MINDSKSIAAIDTSLIVDYIASGEGIDINFTYTPESGTTGMAIAIATDNVTAVGGNRNSKSEKQVIDGVMG